MVKFDIKNIDNLILKINFLFANYYFMTKNLNFNFYISIIEKIKDLNEKNAKEDLIILEKFLKIVNLNTIVKKDLSFFHNETLKIKEILFELQYDLESYCYDLNNKKENNDIVSKYNVLLNEVNDFLEKIDKIIKNIETLFVFDFEKIHDEKNLKKFLLIIYDFKNSLDNFNI